MISPLVILLGALALWYNPVRSRARARCASPDDRGAATSNGMKLRKEIIWAGVLNFILVGSLTFSFPKYLLPMTTLFALASVSYLLKYRWLVWLVMIDSFFVFLPIWNYFGQSFWPNIYVYLLPFWAAMALAFLANKKPLHFD